MSPLRPHTRRRLRQLLALVALEVGVGVAMALWDPDVPRLTGMGQVVLGAAALLYFTVVPLGVLTVLALWAVDACHARRTPAA